MYHPSLFFSEVYRKVLDIEQRIFLKDKGLVTEAECDIGKFGKWNTIMYCMNWQLVRALKLEVELPLD